MTNLDPKFESHWPYPFEDGKFSISLKINKVEQLFNIHDPSPFRHRDLDDDAVEYIVESVAELKQEAPIRLVVHLPDIQPENKVIIEDAIHHYFLYEENLMTKKLRTLLLRGRLFSLIGFLFLFICMYSSYLILSFSDTVLANILGEGLNIIGWVAMWKPVEIFLYDWRPLKRLKHYYSKLKEVEVKFVTA